MSTPGPTGPFDEGNQNFLQEILRALGSASFAVPSSAAGSTGSGALNLDVARQLATYVSTNGKPESNVDPIARIRYEELVRVAEMHVAEYAGLSVRPDSGLLRTTLVTPSEWAGRALVAYEPLLAGLAEALDANGGLLAQLDDDQTDMFGSQDPNNPLGALFGSLSPVLQPLLLGMQAGFMVGHLAQHALGQYDLPIPWPSSNEIVLSQPAIDAFAAEWDLPVDDVRLYVLLHELTVHTVISRPHVRTQLLSLLSDYSRGFSPDTQAMRDQFADLDPNNFASLQNALNDPRAMLNSMQTPAQADVLSRIQGLIVPIVGFVDHVVDVTGRKLIGNVSVIEEALRRRRVGESEGRKFVESLLGVELERSQYERGTAFVDGVIERSGIEGLRRLWTSERELPTPSEVDAPGLWLARIDIADTN